MTKKNDIKELTFEQALSELEEIVEKLEQGDIDLEAVSYTHLRAHET